MLTSLLSRQTASRHERIWAHAHLAVPAPAIAAVLIRGMTWKWTVLQLFAGSETPLGKNKTGVGPNMSIRLPVLLGEQQGLHRHCFLASPQCVFPQVLEHFPLLKEKFPECTALRALADYPEIGLGTGLERQKAEKLGAAEVLGKQDCKAHIASWHAHTIKKYAEMAAERGIKAQESSLTSPRAVWSSSKWWTGL